VGDDAFHVRQHVDAIGALGTKSHLGTPPQTTSRQENVSWIADLKDLALLDRVQVGLLDYIEAKLSGYVAGHPGKPHDVDVFLHCAADAYVLGFVERRLKILAVDPARLDFELDGAPPAGNRDEGR
jgi:hypothetical protein